MDELNYEYARPPLIPLHHQAKRPERNEANDDPPNGCGFLNATKHTTVLSLTEQRGNTQINITGIKPMQILAILISLAAIYAAYAFVSTKLLNKPRFPFDRISLD